MSEYRAPTREMEFALRRLAGFDEMVKACNYEDASSDVVAAILEEAAKFAGNAIAPLNRSGDETGVSLGEDRCVQTPEGFKEAYQQYIEGGWAGLQFDTELGGEGLPFSLAIPVQEMIHAANMAWGLCPLLSQGATEALSENADEPLKRLLLPRMISGEWTGTMNLTEPQSGSDLATIRTQARPEGDHYRITGQKIFITWGEHDMAENIVHLVLARLPDAPAGVKGISLFAVPKFIPDADGNPDERNDCYALSLEHKMGIHASPTCVMSYGENGGALGYLVGQEHQGLACMFTMMNNARLTVGLQGVAVSERALQMARSYVAERIQGTAPGDREQSPIVRHPDVRRMMMTMKTLTEAGRGLAYSGCVAVDYAKHAQLDTERRAYFKRRADLLTPLVKGWCTEIAQEVTSLAVQCHGGMGFIEETGVAQLYRDARILPIYEGTNGIQALDLIGRKTIRDGGLALQELLTEMRATAEEARTAAALDGRRIDAFEQSFQQLEDALQLVLGSSTNEHFVASVAFDFLMLTSTVTAAWLMVKSALLAANETDEMFLQGRQATARFFIDHILPRSAGYLASVQAGEDSIMALPETAL